jgi:hypothetical protein
MVFEYALVVPNATCAWSESHLLDMDLSQTFTVVLMPGLPASVLCVVVLGGSFLG